MGILIYLGLGWVLMYLYREVLSGRKQKLRRRLKFLANQLKDRRHWDADVLSLQHLEFMQATEAKARELRTGNVELKEIEEFLKDANQQLAKIYPRQASDTPHEIIELLVVVFGIVMGIRALFLQPFKIPTGSMQPTLYGVHFEETPRATGLRPALMRFFDYLNRGGTQVYQTIDSDCMISIHDFAPPDPDHRSSPVSNADGKVRQGSFLELGSLKFGEYTQVRLGDRFYRFPGPPTDVARRIFHLDEGLGIKTFSQGETISGDLLIGDHLFVDRLSYNFSEPRRGDIVVFTTVGIRYGTGESLAGLHYIKRLAGLPGETLQIRDRRLYVKGAGEAKFRLIDGSARRAYDRIYSMKGGYRGYSHPDGPRCQYLLTDDQTFTLGPDEYFMLGDNTENSADSRYWGIVPRRNIIGRAFWVWWPFSRRWGPVDRVEPLDYSSAPPAATEVPTLGAPLPDAP